MITNPYTVDDLIRHLYEQDTAHFDFIEDMSGGDCDCVLHKSMDFLLDAMSWRDG